MWLPLTVLRRLDCVLEGTKAFDREVKPHVPDARIDRGIRDHKDGEVGKVGCEINFNRYFYKYTPSRPLEAIEADIRKIEKESMEMLPRCVS